MGAEQNETEWTLDSGAEGVRLEVTAGRRLTVQLPRFDPIEHRDRPLHVTEYDPVSAEDTRSCAHPVSADGTITLYGLRDDRRYALWWSAPGEDLYAYAPDVSPTAGSRTLDIRTGRSIHVQVVRPGGWAGWPRIRAEARGIRAFGIWLPDGENYRIDALPPGEFVVTAEGQDLSNREVVGELRMQSGDSATLELSLR